MKKTDPPIVVEANFNKSANELWKALTNINEMKKWYFDVMDDFQPTVGFKINFKVHSEDRVFTHQWEVIEVVPHKKITYSWRFLEYPGASTSCFEVFGDQNSSRLQLTILVQSDFPQDIPEFKRESCIGGWDYFIQGNLKKYMAAL
ncbi:SRPBCC domain-containing protein [uncultured Muriicola sp.]|uniref:SRPBCC family protein n=1 Tax=uncultured Muriicola sp. TaxID=1583102 RepID=UPI0026249D03|nr:SRPBCC domain-containing protein [uncultured Muriicola sp.]